MCVCVCSDHLKYYSLVEDLKFKVQIMNLNYFFFLLV